MLIKRFEGYKPLAYLDTNDVPTIGYGCTLHLNGDKVKIGDVITAEKAEQMLAKNIFDIEESLIKYIKIKLSDNQLSALISLVYNIGIGNFKNSTMLKMINKSKFLDAANEFNRWIWDNGKIIKGLVTRRAHEKEIFLS